jgi:tetratricopeptide (TPR) repeat protein/TPR repeat protein
MVNAKGNNGQVGLLSSGQKRKSFWKFAAELYRSNTAFRGMTDFAVIGAVVLMFLSPPQDVVWPWDRAGTASTDVPTAGRNSNPAASSTKTPIAGATVAGPVIPIEYYDDVKDPKLARGFFVSIDDSEFRTSSASDQALLAQARIQYALSRPDDALNLLRDATPSDANVLVLRGAASFAKGTSDGYGAAQALWRAAVNGGSKQAQALLGALLVSGLPGTTQNAAEGLRLVEAGVTAGDPQAMRLAAIGYMSGEFGRFDAFKAVELFKRAADAGDAKAAEFYSRAAAEGIAAPSPDGKKAELYLRKAADAGDTSAQGVLGYWLLVQDEKQLIADPKEAIDWLMRSYNRGHDVGALVDLSQFHLSGVDPKWSNPTQGAELARKCSGFKVGNCLVNTAQAYAHGLYGTVNLPFARALYSVARQFNGSNSEEGVQWADSQLSPADKTRASNLEPVILAQLQPPPPVIQFQYRDLPIASPPVAIVNDQTPSFSGGDASSDMGLCSNESSVLSEERDACTRIINSPTATDLDRSRAFFERGWTFDREKNVEAAFADYSESIKLNPNYSPARNNRGGIYQSKNNLDAALADFNAAITADPKFVPALVRRSGIMLSSHQYAQSLADASAVLSVDPNNVPALQLRADSHFFSGRYDLALSSYTELLRVTPTNAQALNNLGASKLALGPENFDAAMSDFEQAIHLNPKLTWPYYNRAKINFAKNKLSIAASDLDVAIQLDPTNSDAVKLRESINKRLGR